MIHAVKGFGIVSKSEIDVFLELSCFFNDPADAGTLISGSSAFSKTSLNIWKFTVHILLKPGLGGGLITKSCPTLVTLWTVGRQAPLSMGFSRKEYLSGLPFLSPVELPDPGIEPATPALQVFSCIAGRFLTGRATRGAHAIQ